MKPADHSSKTKLARCGTVVSDAGTLAGKTWLRGLFGVAAGLLNMGQSAGEEVPVGQTEYRSATAAPAEWQEFTKRLQQRIQERLAGQDDDARKFREAIASQSGKAGEPPFRLRLRTWIEPDGKIARIEVEGFDEKSATAEYMRRLLRLDGIGAPPADMLQPVRLGLSLRAQEPESAAKEPESAAK